MIQKYFWFFGCILAWAAAAHAQMPASQDQARQYQYCTELVGKAPNEALAFAENWRHESPTLAADHCRALALFGLGQYGIAADELEKLALATGQERGNLWISLMRQSGAAWHTAGNNLKAHAALAKAVAHAEEQSMGQLAQDVLLEKAGYNIKAGQRFDAIQDLDHALMLNPENPKALELRAEQLLAIKEQSLAKKDIEALRKIDPNSAQAKELAQQVAPKAKATSKKTRKSTKKASPKKKATKAKKKTN